MAKALRWILTFIAILVLTAVFEPPLMAYFAHLGWHDEPSEIVSDVVNWIAQIVGVQTFPWVAAGLLGATIGSWLHFAAARLDRTRMAIDRGKASDIGSRMISRSLMIRGEARNYLSPQGVLPREDPNTQLPEILSILASCKKIGLTIPDFLSADLEDRLYGAEWFFRSLGPLVRDGEIAEAKRLSATLCEEINQAELTELQSRQSLAEETRR